MSKLIMMQPTFTLLHDRGKLESVRVKELSEKKDYAHVEDPTEPVSKPQTSYL